MQPCRLEKPLTLAIAIYSTIDKEYIYIIEKNPVSIRPPSLLFTLGWGVFQTYCFYDWRNGMVTPPPPPHQFIAVYGANAPYHSLLG